MASVYSKNLQIYNAEQFKRSIEEVGEPYIYFTFGRAEAWANEAAPPQANTSVHAQNEVWKNMIGVKQVQGNDIRLGVRRNNWSNGTVYFAFDDCGCSLNMNNPDIKYFIVTDDWNVYKCISNNNGALSTVKPTSTITNSSIETSDRYVWKYMYTLTDEERLRFVTRDYIPVKTLKEDNGSLQWQVQQNAVAGAIEAIEVKSGGSNYTNPPIVSITGDGTGATAVARVTNGAVTGVVITNKGADYTTATVSFSSPTGSGATADPVISPRGGHGSDPVEELGGSHIIINTRLRGSEGSILDVDNEFRQIALIKNPLLKDTNNLASNLAYSQTTTVYVDSIGSEYQKDEIVYQGGSLETATFRGTIVSWKPAESRLELSNVSGIPKSGVLTGITSKTAREYVRHLDCDLEPYSGSLLYKDNMVAIQRAEDQTEDFKIVLSF